MKFDYHYFICTMICIPIFSGCAIKSDNQIIAQSGVICSGEYKENNFYGLKSIYDKTEKKLRDGIEFEQVKSFGFKLQDLNNEQDEILNLYYDCMNTKINNGRQKRNKFLNRIQLEGGLGGTAKNDHLGKIGLNYEMLRFSNNDYIFTELDINYFSLKTEYTTLSGIEPITDNVDTFNPSFGVGYTGFLNSTYYLKPSVGAVVTNGNPALYGSISCGKYFNQHVSLEVNYKYFNTGFDKENVFFNPLGVSKSEKVKSMQFLSILLGWKL